MEERKWQSGRYMTGSRGDWEFAVARDLALQGCARFLAIADFVRMECNRGATGGRG